MLDDTTLAALRAFAGPMRPLSLDLRLRADVAQWEAAGVAFGPNATDADYHEALARMLAATLVAMMEK